MNYDIWLLRCPGGPYDDQPVASEYERAQQEFHELNSSQQARVRRRGKRSTQRRIRNPDWARRQRREDINGQRIY